MYNGCINILSSRKRCLPLCLKSLWDNWNYRYDYPVYVHYFDDIYDSQEYRELIREKISRNIHFRPVPYQTPSFLKEEELFYNRKDLWYVNSGRFTIRRKGYLHMSNYFNNFYGYENTEFQKYDYVMSIDDESSFLKEVPYDFFEVISKRKELAGALKVTHAKNKPPHQGNFDCRVGMWEHIKNYITKHNIEPKSDFIKNLLIDPEADKNFHFKSGADSYVFKMELFETPEWKLWNKELNECGGVYKYRWGDDELNYLFFLIHHDYVVYDFKTVDEGYHNQGGLRHIQDYAPGVKDNSR
tara:strand:+ start:7683 stop:8579 length:897 start_codon:yes stop_codon:yes gene_type:complete